MNPIDQLVDHLQLFRACSGDAQPTPDQWREIQEKVQAAALYRNTGTLQGTGDMNKTTEHIVGISC